jgi:ATP-dependent Clp protease protease subunit
MSHLMPYVIERTAVGERSYDLPSRLLKDRIIFLNGEVNDQVSHSICAQLLFLDSESSADIHFYINSPGGVVTAGLAIFDTMQYVKSDVSTIVTGQACSMGSLLASSGARGKRLITQHARHLIHQPLGGARGQASDIEIQAREILRLKAELTEIYVENTGKSYNQLERDMDRDCIMNAEESVAYGLADQIITQRV